MNRNQLTKAMKEVIAAMVLLIKDGKTDEEILTASKTDMIGEKECTDELLAELLGFAKADAEKESKTVTKEDLTGTMFGNADAESKYPFPKAWGNSVVVRESVEAKIGPKATDIAEIPSSIKIKPFDKTLFDTHVKQGMFDKKKVEVIHDPR